MGLLDNIRDRVFGGGQDSYEQDDYGYDDEGYADDDFEADRGSYQSQRRPGGSGLLGNTPRPEAESVNVYTRSGNPLTQAPAANARVGEPTARSHRYDIDNTGTIPLGVSRPSTPSRFRPLESSQNNGYENAYERARVTPSTTPVSTPSTTLPAYVLRPHSYDDVQSVVRRVKTGQPVVLNFKGSNLDVAKRVLDFCFGLSVGISGTVTELGDRTFAVLPQGVTLSQADIDKLQADGDLER